MHSAYIMKTTYRNEFKERKLFGKVRMLGKLYSKRCILPKVCIQMHTNFPSYFLKKITIGIETV